MYKFNKNSRYIENSDKIIIGNIEIGEWIKISKEVFNILNLGIDKKITFEELKLNLYDDDDREYIQQLYNRMHEICIIDEEHDEELSNEIVSFEITHRCNLNCKHCCVDADGVKSDSDDLSTDEMKSIFDKIIKWNPRRIMLSGGEPMLRKDFLELLTYLKSNYNGQIVLSTNGTFITEENVNVLSDSVYQIDISLDGVDEESCSIVRGRGVFGKVINNVKLLKDNGFNNITLSMAMGEKNEHLESKFKELNKSLGTKPLIRIFSPVGRGKENIALFSESGIQEVYIPQEYLSDDYDKTFGVCSCSAGKRELLISHKGDLYPCIAFMNEENKLGNIIDISDLNEFTCNNIKNQFDRILSSEDHKGCKECKVNLFCWTCPGEFEELKDNKLAFDDRCSKIKPVLYKRVWGR